LKGRVLKILGGLVAAIALFVAILLVSALTESSAQVDVDPTKFRAPDGAAQRLQQAVRFKTVSNADPSKMNMEEFARFNDFLVTAYPKAHSVLKRELVPPCSVVYTWPGSDAAAQPVLMISHNDVVPVEDDQLDKW